MSKFSKITSTIAARRVDSWTGPDYRFDLAHPDGETDTDLNDRQAIEILTARYPEASSNALYDAFERAKNEAYQRNPDLLAEARSAALQSQLTTGRSYLVRDVPAAGANADQGVEGGTPAPAAAPTPEQDAARHLADAASTVTGGPATPEGSPGAGPGQELPPSRTASTPEVER